MTIQSIEPAWEVDSCHTVSIADNLSANPKQSEIEFAGESKFDQHGFDYQ